MTGVEREIWFPAKRWGWGWGPPVKWQGWVVLLAYGVLLTVGSIWLLLLESVMGTVLYALWIVGLTAILIAVCRWKGERPRWRWGDDSE